MTAYLLSREVYRRSDIMILHRPDGAMVVAAVQRRESDALFCGVDKVEILAYPDQCVFIESPETDPANRSALAKTAYDHGVTSEQTAIIHGIFDNINLIHHPDPLIVSVVEVTPPDPPKLFHMAQQVLGYADLPPILLQLETIDLRRLCSDVTPECYLVPCRSGGLDDLGAPVYFLDERPADRENWTLIGCERSLQFHQHYYGDIPPRVEMCPKKLGSKFEGRVLLKCCLLEFHIEFEDQLAIIPWGADLVMVEEALLGLSTGIRNV